MNGSTKVHVRLLLVIMSIVFATIMLIQGFEKPAIGIASITIPPPRFPSQEQAKSINRLEDHVLLHSTDIVSAGGIEALPILHPQSITESISSTNPISNTWQDVVMNSFLVSSKSITTMTFLAESLSYGFPYTTTAQTFLDSLPNNPSLLDFAFIGDLESHNIEWRAWYFHDMEGMPTWTFFMAYEQFVLQLSLTSSFQGVNQAPLLFKHLVTRLFRRSIGQVVISEIFLPNVVYDATNNRNSPKPSLLQNTLSISNIPSAQSIYGVRPDKIPGVAIYPVGSEQTLVYTMNWNAPNNDAHDPHFHGTGSDSATCVSGIGCISNWPWINDSNSKRLIIPRSFFTSSPIERVDPRKYSATATTNCSLPGCVIRRPGSSNAWRANRVEKATSGYCFSYDDVFNFDWRVTYDTNSGIWQNLSDTSRVYLYGADSNKIQFMPMPQGGASAEDGTLPGITLCLSSSLTIDEAWAHGFGSMEARLQIQQSPLFPIQHQTQRLRQRSKALVS